MEADLGASSASAGAATQDLGATRTSSQGNLADTKQLETTVREGMSLIDRFYNGGNRARPAALDILVVVLDGVVRRMRQQYATRQTNLSEGDAEIARIDQSIAAIQKRQSPLIKELEQKKARAAELKAAVEKGESVINESVTVARAALEKANLLQRATEKSFIAGVKLCAPPHRLALPPVSGSPAPAAALAPLPCCGASHHAPPAHAPNLAAPRRATTARGTRSRGGRSTCESGTRSRHASQATWRRRTTRR
jgi:hypothetical protein